MTILKKIQGYFIADSDRDDIPVIMAEFFCNACSNDQARFFNAVNNISQQWESPPEFQWRYMQDNLTTEARNMLLAMYKHTDGVE